MHDPWKFYKIMHYPIPTAKEYVAWKKQFSVKKQVTNGFSRDKKNPYLETLLQKIHKYGWLYKSLPFVSHIYLCNSITFNALHETSDIDLFFVVKKGAIRRARFFSVIYFWLLGIKRHKKNIAQQFCLTFYITEDKQNLIDISLKDDVYLIYRLAHLVPLYHEKTDIDNNIHQHNTWYQSFLPTHPGKHIINIGNNIYYKNTRGKKIIEWVAGGLRGNIVERIIKSIRKPLVIKKNNTQGDNKKHIIISDTMLKFHQDRRKKIKHIFQ